MCGSVFTQWSRPVQDADFDHLERSVAGEDRAIELVHALRQAFSGPGMRPTVFIIALVLESFRSVGRPFVEGFPKMVRFGFSAYTYVEGHVTARYQTDFQAAVHDQMPEFLMSSQTVHRMNLVLGRFGFAVMTDHCCGEIFLPKEDVAAFLESPRFAQREAARQEATKQGMRFKRVRNTGSIPFEGSDLGPAERNLHDRLARQMVRLCGPLTKAHEPLRKPVSIAPPVRRLAAA
jgi:hypothetical protein